MVDLPHVIILILRPTGDPQLLLEFAFTDLELLAVHELVKDGHVPLKRVKHLARNNTVYLVSVALQWEGSPHTLGYRHQTRCLSDKDEPPFTGNDIKDRELAILSTVTGNT